MSLTYVGKITLGKRKYLMDIYMLYAMVIRGIKIRNFYVSKCVLKRILQPNSNYNGLHIRS